MKKLALTLLVGTLLTACGDNKDYLVKIKTSYGDMTVLLYDETPLHKKNFLELAQSGRYDSTVFHRVIENFMIQGGNIYEKEGIQEKESDRIPAEIVDGLYHTKGALAAARQGDQVNPERMSSGSQFYIVDGNSWEMMSTDINQLYAKMTQLLQDTSNRELIEEYQEVYAQRDNRKIMEFLISKKGMVEEKLGVDLTIDPKTGNNEAYQNLGGSPHLDKEYTVFGRVVEGIDVIDKIAAVQTRPGDRPVEDIVMTMEIIEMKKKEITEKYGYAYSE
ncbi:MAG: peptidylprolyl isomerase [Ekhidna sp.]